jgi:radical SAM protein with 4Fe4S-binding SPASM domain
LTISEIIQLNRWLEKKLLHKSKLKVYFDIPLVFLSIRKLTYGQLGRCQILNILGILSGGEISLCGIGVNVPELIFGHMGVDNLRDLWHENPGLTRLREKIPAQLEGICSNCLLRDICLGTCVAHNFYLTGKLNAPYDFCRQAESLNLFPNSRKKEINKN